MSSIYVIPLGIVIVAVTFGVARALLRVWLDHRLKLALLEKYESHPELFDSADEIATLSAQRDQLEKVPQRQDYTVTGIILTLMGVCCILAGRVIGVGKLAVGIYTGGFICVVLGILMGLVGLLIRALAKNAFAQTSDH